MTTMTRMAISRVLVVGGRVVVMRVAWSEHFFVDIYFIYLNMIFS